MVKKIKTKHPVCVKCSSWYHKTQDCTWKLNCTKCGEVHLNDLCSLKKFFTCSLSTKGSCMMSLQDVPVKDSPTKARIMFDNGSKLTLVSSFFAKKNNFSYEEATYTISGVGGAETTFNSGNKGRIYNIPLLETNGDTVIIKAFAVDSILSGKIGHEEVKLNREDFPHLTKKELQEAGKSLPKRHLDILIGNPDLGLQPVCRVGFGCSDCRKGRCLYKSRFSEGVVPLGLLLSPRSSM